MHHIRIWTIPKQLSPPRPGELHLWHIRLDTGQNNLCGLLSPQELERANLLLDRCEQNRFIQGRGALRAILGHYLGHPPEQIIFSYGNQGKPHISEPKCTLSFNLSHSADFAILALTQNHGIGVDLEKPRPKVNIMRIAHRLFEEEAQQELANLEEPERTMAFYRYWTAYEAGMKRHGLGIFDRAKLPEGGTGEVVNFSPQEGWIGAIAMGKVPPFKQWQTFSFDDWQLQHHST